MFIIQTQMVFISSGGLVDQTEMFYKISNVWKQSGKKWIARTPM